MIVRERRLDRQVSSTCGREYVGRLDEVAFESLKDMLSVRPRRDTECSYSWLGVRSMEELTYKVENGWPELEQRMLSMLDEIQLPPALLRPELSRRRRRCRGDHGNELDIHEVYQGRVDRAWTKTHKEPLMSQGNKTAHICINLGAASGMYFEAALWRGALALRIYETLTRMGRSVAISGYYASVGGFRCGTGFMGSCQLKDYGEPMRTDKLASMVNLGFMRRYLMTWCIESHPHKTPSSGYGYPIDDYELWTYAAEEDRMHGGSTYMVGACFSKQQADQALEKFTAQLLGDSNIEGLSPDELMKHV